VLKLFNSEVKKIFNYSIYLTINDASHLFEMFSVPQDIKICSDLSHRIYQIDANNGVLQHTQLHSYE